MPPRRILDLRFESAVVPITESLRTWASRLRRDIAALYLAARDPRVPWYAKGLAAAVVAYALSPIDVIPDFVPVLGYLDDLIIVPLGIALVIRLIPRDVLDDLRIRANREASMRGAGLAGAMFIVTVWLAGAAGVIALLVAPEPAP